jgi:hypothetical protein
MTSIVGGGFSFATDGAIWLVIRLGEPYKRANYTIYRVVADSSFSPSNPSHHGKVYEGQKPPSPIVRSVAGCSTATKSLFHDSFLPI